MHLPDRNMLIFLFSVSNCLMSGCVRQIHNLKWNHFTTVRWHFNYVGKDGSNLTRGPLLKKMSDCSVDENAFISSPVWLKKNVSERKGEINFHVFPIISRYLQVLVWCFGRLGGRCIRVSRREHPLLSSGRLSAFAPSRSPPHGRLGFKQHKPQRKAVQFIGIFFLKKETCL